MGYKNNSSIIGTRDLFSREIKFLTYCSRIAMDAQAKEELEALADSGFDWPNLVFEAAKQGVAQFLYLHLPKSEKIWLSIPQESRDMLRRLYFRTLSENWLTLRELQKINFLLNQASIQPIVLKGASLLETVYKNIALRPMVDVDLLVDKKDLSEVKTILCDYGYRKPDFLTQDSLEKFGGEIHLYKSDIFLDIHSSLSQYERFKEVFKIDLDEEIWAKSIVVRAQEGEKRILHPNHLLIHLCMHQAVSHYFRGLFRFCDLRETILAYQQELDWQYIIEKAQAYKIKKIIYYSLNFMQGLFGLILPEDILNRLKPKRKELILSDFFVSKREILALPDKEIGFRKSVVQLFMMDSLLVVPKIIFKGLFPSDEWLKYRYGIHKKTEVIFYRIFHPFITVFNILS